MLAVIICEFHGGENVSPVTKEQNMVWAKSKQKQQKNKPKQPKLQSGREERHKTPNTSLTMEDTLLLFFKASLNISTLGRNQMQNICIFKLASIYLDHSNLIQFRYTPRRSTVTAFPIPTHEHSVSVMITHTGLLFQNRKKRNAGAKLFTQPGFHFSNSERAFSHITQWWQSTCGTQVKNTFPPSFF